MSDDSRSTVEQKTSQGADNSPTGRDELPFTRLGHYEVVGWIGHGGMGDVYRGYERTLDRTVALKVLPAELSREPEFVRRFYAEASAAARVVHPHVIQIHFIGEDAGHHFFAMQYVDGESLDALLTRRGKLTLVETLLILEQVLSGLSAAHRQGLIHRDIKPGNILLDRVHQRALLADFGLVKSLAALEGRTATGIVMGTVDYIAPEQGRGQPVDHRVDLYAVGVLIHQLLCGRLPFTGDSPTSVIFQHVYERPPSLCELVSDVPATLGAVVAKLMAKSRESRHASADAVLADIQAIREGLPLPSGADVDLAANPHAFMAPTLSGADETPRSRVIQTPQFADEPPIPTAFLDPVHSTWWNRTRDWWTNWIRSKTPVWVQQMQSTQHQIDGAVDEYERRRDQLQRLVREAEDVLATLQATLAKGGGDAELRHATADQEEQLGEMRLRLAQAEATLQKLRNQRDIISARLKAAQAKLHLAGKRIPAKSQLRRRIVIVAVVVVVPTTILALAFGPVMKPWIGENKGRESPSEAPNIPLLTEVFGDQKLLSVDLQSTAQRLTFGSENRVIAAVTTDGSIELRDAVGGQLLKAIKTKAGRPQDIVVSLDGNYAAAVSNSTASVRNLEIWDLRQGDQPASAATFDGSIRLLGFVGTPPKLLLQSTDGATNELIRVSVGTQDQQARTPLVVDIGDSLVIDSISRRLAVYGSEKVTLADVEVQGGLKSVRSMAASATALAIHPNNGTLAVGTGEGTITVWDKTLQRPLMRLTGPKSSITTLAYDDTGRWLAASDKDQVRIWDLGLQYVRAIIRTSQVTSLAYSPGGKQLVLITDGTRMQIWDTEFPTLEINFDSWISGLNSEQRDRVLQKYSKPVPINVKEASTSDGRLTVFARPNQVPFVRDNDSGRDLHQLILHESRSALSVAVSPNNRLVATGSYDSERGIGDVRLWDIRTGRELGKFIGHVHYAWAVAFSPDGEQLLSGGRNTLHLWSVRSQKEIRRFRTPFPVVRQVAFSGDGQRVTASNDGGAPGNHMLFDVATGDALLQFYANSPRSAFDTFDEIRDQRFGAIHSLDTPQGKTQLDAAR